MMGEEQLETQVNGARPIREGLLLHTSSGIENVRLAGSRCANCSEVSLGAVSLCPNCGGDELEVIALSSQGILWSYTVARHKPPGDYRGPEPFEPYGIGLVELPEGVRVVSRIDGDINELQVGKSMVFAPDLRHDPEGDDVIVFSFRFDEGMAE